MYGMHGRSWIHRRCVASGVEVVRDDPGWTVCVVDRDLLRATLDAAGIVETDREI